MSDTRVSGRGSVALKTVGCRLNQAESAEMADTFRAHGIDVVDSEAEIVVVNTCTVTAESSRTSRKLIRRVIEENPRARVIITGCYAVASPTEIAAIPGVSQVVPNKEKDQIALKVVGDSTRSAGLEPDETSPRRTLKVQTGCDETCTYCIVPQTRGTPLSRPLAEVIEAARRLVEAGTREITLSGVHLGRYGIEVGLGVVNLIESLLAALPDEVSLRLSSIEMTCVTGELIELMATEPRICRHLHMPLQSGDNQILAAMGRPYLVGHFCEVAEHALSIVSGLALTTDVMVGFPGESEKAFANTVGVVERLGFMKLHVFRYSPREGTRAAKLPDSVPAAVQRERSTVLRSMSDRLRLEFHQRNALAPGRVVALVEAIGAATSRDPGRPALYGVTDNYMKVHTSGPAGYLGQYVELDVESVTSETIFGAPLNDQALRGSGRPG